MISGVSKPIFMMEPLSFANFVSFWSTRWLSKKGSTCIECFGSKCSHCLAIFNVTPRAGRRCCSTCPRVSINTLWLGWSQSASWASLFWDTMVRLCCPTFLSVAGVNTKSADLVSWRKESKRCCTPWWNDGNSEQNSLGSKGGFWECNQIFRNRNWIPN